MTSSMPSPSFHAFTNTYVIYHFPRTLAGRYTTLQDPRMISGTVYIEAEVRINRLYSETEWKFFVVDGAPEGDVNSEGAKVPGLLYCVGTFYSPGTSRDHYCKVSRHPGTVPSGHETSRDQGSVLSRDVSCPGLLKIRKPRTSLPNP